MAHRTWHNPLLRAEFGDEPPPELTRLREYRSWWYVAAAVCIILTALLVAGVLPGRSGDWLAWVGNGFEAVYVTLNFFLVVLTYNLFQSATRVTEQNERIHRVSQLPIVVAEIEPLTHDPRPSYSIQISNEGNGPAFDINISLDYRLKTENGAGAALNDTGTTAHASLGVINKASKSSVIAIDARGIMLAKPWQGRNLALDGAPTRAETTALLAPYRLEVRITYKDIYSQEGRTVYEAHQADAELGIALTELLAPAVAVGSRVKPIVFTRTESASVENQTHAARG